MKKIVSLLLILIMSMSFIPSAYAEESGDVFEITHLVTGIHSDGYFSCSMVHNLTSDTQTGVLVITTYSGDGKLLDFAYTDISVAPNSSSYHIVNFESRPTAFQKAFIWDGFGTFKPLAETHCMELDKSDDIHFKMFDPQITLPNEKQFHANYPHICYDDGFLYVTLADSVDIYVNGALYTTISPEADVEEGLTDSQAMLDAIFAQARDQVIFVRGNPEDFAYTEIHVTCYQVAEVTTVDSNSSNTNISLQGIKGCIDKNSDSATWDYILIDNDAVESGDVTVNVTRNGKESTLSSLKKGDIIAYAANFKAENGLVNPEKIDIIAISNSTISGKVTYVDLNNSKTPNDNIYVISSGNTCEVIPGEASDPDICYGDSIKVTLDPFNRIYDYEIEPYEIESSSTNYAIALKLILENEFIRLLLPDGSLKTYELDIKKANNFYKDFVEDKINNEIWVEDRVVTYEVSDTNGKIISINKISADSVFYDVEYTSGSLGSDNKILDTTPIIYIDEDYNGTTETFSSSAYTFLTKDDLIDGSEYSGYIYKNGAAVDLVILTHIRSIFNRNSRFAVAMDVPGDMITAEGDRAKYVDILYNGKIQTLYFANNGVSDNLVGGDIFFFETSNDGFVDAIYTPDPSDWYWAEKVDLHDWSYNIWNEYAQIQLAQGVVVEVTSDYVALASVEQVESGYLDTTLSLDDTHTDGIVTYDFADDCVAYTYDSTSHSPHENHKYDFVSPSSIKSSNLTSFDSGNGVMDDGIYAGEDMMSKATEAIVMIVEGEVVEIFAIEK